MSRTFRASSRALAIGRALRAGGRFGDGRTAVRLGVLVTALVGLLALAVHLWPQAGPTRLDQVALVGDRSPGCVRLVVLVDQSGSMADYAPARQAALAQIVAWAPDNLRADDELVVVNWAGSAQLALSPTRVRDFSSARIAGVALDVPDGTVLDGVLEQLAALPATSCRTALLFLSDGVLTETPVEDVDEVLGDAGVVTVATVLPGSGDVPPAWVSLFPYGTTTEAAATDAAGNALVVATVLAEVTGQHIEEVDP